MKTSEDVIAQMDLFLGRTAAISMKEIGKVNRMTSGNDHTGAIMEVARLLKMKKHQKIFEGIAMISVAVGSTPNDLITLRNHYSKEVYAKAKTVKIKDADGNPVTVYELLD